MPRLFMLSRSSPVRPFGASYHVTAVTSAKVTISARIIVIYSGNKGFASLHRGRLVVLNIVFLGTISDAFAGLTI
jgi:hypothetical protein